MNWLDDIMRRLEDYRKLVGDETIAEIYRKARALYGKSIININSTYLGGGVAEMMSSLAPLINDAGLDADWRILHGNHDFFTITKKFHNALQGGDINLTRMKEQIYLETNENFSGYAHIDRYDCVIVHDPQPLALVKFYKKSQPWLWQCHIDLSNPNRTLWNFMKGFILKYDGVIVSDQSYVREDMPIEHYVIPPAIDPLSQKNVNLPERIISKNLEKYHVPLDKPIILQVSRFDPWKDPLGVVEIFKRVKKQVDCRLVLCGNMATDDPEGPRIYEKTKKAANDLVESGDVIFVVNSNDITVNALQKSASVVIQKSQRGGFGLTVTEALWKKKPVVASKVGGIPKQIVDGETGFLLEPNDIKGFAQRIVHLLNNPEVGEEMGRKGRDFVRKNFLITRLIIDYLDLISKVVL